MRQVIVREANGAYTSLIVSRVTGIYPQAAMPERTVIDYVSTNGVAETHLTCAGDCEIDFYRRGES